MRRNTARITWAAGLALTVSFLLCPCASAEQTNTVVRPGPDQLFVEAGHLYDQNRFNEAAAKYEQILREGWRSPELLFNLGNAYFKSGRTDMSVLYYRRAWYMAPRDPDIRANLKYALQTAAAPPPDLRAHERQLSLLSKREWFMLAVVSWWGACVAFAFGVWVRRYRPLLFRAGTLLFSVLLISLVGIWTWHGLSVRPEQVVVGGPQEVRFAPLENAVLHFVLPQGSIVRLLEVSEGWAKISADRKQGWVKQSGLMPVLSAEHDIGM